MKSKARPTQQLDVNRIFFPSFFFLAVKRVHSPSRSCKLGYLKLLSRGYERYTNYPLRSFNIRQDLSNLSFFSNIISSFLGTIKSFFIRVAIGQVVTNKFKRIIIM